MPKAKKTEKVETPEYTLRMNQRQLVLVRNALEEYFRLRMGQTWDLAEELAFQHYDYKDHPEGEFNRRLTARDDCKALLEQAMDAASRKNWKHWQKTDEVMTAIDMWTVIRNFFWKQKPESERHPYTTDADPLYLWGPEPGIVIEKVKSRE